MRWARSYSIVDHELLHGKYFHRLSHEALSLYLFFVVVGDREGRSFYGERSISEILRFSAEQFRHAREQLLNLGLIRSGGPYVWVRNLYGNHEQQGTKKQDNIPARGGAVKHQTDRRGTWHLAGSVLADLVGQVRRSATEDVLP